MEPRIRYAQTSDGVSIAFWTLEGGRPGLVPVPVLFVLPHLEWRFPKLRLCFERLAEGGMPR